MGRLRRRLRPRRGLEWGMLSAWMGVFRTSSFGDGCGYGSIYQENQVLSMGPHRSRCWMLQVIPGIGCKDIGLSLVF